MLTSTGGFASSRTTRALADVFCVFALMWPALFNGQPFFFPDSTSYVRAGDAILHRLSGGRVSTEWTARYDHESAATPKALVEGGAADEAPPPEARGNDPDSGTIMAGRSPYFGAVLFATYLISDFWGFVFLQALACHALIVLCVRRFVPGASATREVVTSLTIAAFTTAPFFNSYLMPDALAGLGLVSLALLLLDGGRTSGWGSVFPWLVLGLSVVAHVTHMLVFFAATLAVAVVRFATDRQGANVAKSIGLGVFVVVLGVGSSAITDRVVTRVFGRSPQLVPYLTARFVEDGPGARFLQEHCDTRHFAVCSFRDRLPVHSDTFLWSADPSIGVFLTADPDTRRRLSQEDWAFATAVLREYPVAQLWSIVSNTFVQAAMFDSDWLNYGARSTPRWLESLPPRQREAAKRSRSGSDAWPVEALSTVHYVVVILAFIWASIELFRRRVGGKPLGEEPVRLALLVLVGVAVNAALAGGLSLPSSRYQGRIVWVAILAATILATRRGDQRVTV